MNRPRGHIKKCVVEKIESSAPHSIFFISDFMSVGSPETIRKIFVQILEEGKLERVGKGIYVKPKDSRFGRVPVPLENVVKEIAERDHCRIIPSGSTAANLLGLSSQVPMNLSYITSGSTRSLDIDGRIVQFRHASPKNFAAKGSTMPIIIQGLKEIGENNLKDTIFAPIRKFIEKMSDPFFEEDLLLAPIWIQTVVKNIIKLEK